jgi:phospholipid/cholesterol/gamma-HCH transport system substrate-binding protein
MRGGVKWLAGAAVFVVAALTGGFLLLGADSGYKVRLVLPDAANLLSGSRVEIRGEQVGQITELSTKDGKAIVTAALDDVADVPLHAGTGVQVQWRGLLGERVVELMPAPASNPAIPSGGMIAGGTEQVELDQVLSALDPATRDHLKSVVDQLNTNLKARPEELRDTLRTAGPAVQQLGAVLRAVGQDGPAIKTLISNLQQVMSPLSDRKEQLSSTVGELSNAMDAMAREQGQIQQALAQLPSTLDAAQQTMDKVPDTVDATTPLLHDLQPATQQLTSVSENLSPLLTDLRPTIADLRPTLGAASSLLRQTPALLDNAHAVVPELTKTVTNLSPAVRFLRPYTPDLMGWISNWSGAFANYDALGHYFHGLVQVGPNAFDDNPGANAGLKGGPNSRPAPGMASGSGWVDANGSGPR